MTNSGGIEIVRRVLNHACFDIFQDNSVWLKYSRFGPGSDAGNRLNHYNQAVELADTPTLSVQYVEALGGYSTDARQNALTFLDHLGTIVEFPIVAMVHASRRIGDPLDGNPIIERLAALQRPDYENYQEHRARFEAISKFVQIVTGDPTASLIVPDSKADLLVERNGDFLLPLDNLGSGISQVIMLAAHATVEVNRVVCMEEPEVHLHPLLQRKLLRYLAEETENQYVIATHSAHVLDSTLASVFHATLEADGTHLAYAGTPEELSKIAFDLGYRPSDLLQTNFAIWVEGPSDRIYISRWLYLMNENLREGIDYSIMFYGGRLLSHLSAKDPLDMDVVEDFISLRRINRCLAVVIDSDMSSADGKISPTKLRIESEVTSGNESGVVWITAGRYIESYIPRSELADYLSGQYPDKKLANNLTRYSDPLRPQDKTSTWRPDKVKIAKNISARWKSGLDYLDLYDRIADLARLIEDANGHQSPVRPAREAPVFQSDEDA